MGASMTLAKFVGWDAKRGRAKRGAISRVAEHLQCNYATVQKWLRGEWEPGESTKLQIREMIRAGIALEAKKRPDRTR